MIGRTLRAFSILICLAACAAAGGGDRQKLYAYVGMTARELNAQDLMKVRNQSITETDIPWIGVNGPLELVTKVGGKQMSFPVSGPNDGVQLAGWKGLNQEFKETKIRVIDFTYDKKHVSFSESISISRDLCSAAYSAGLRPIESEGRLMNELTENDVNEVATSLSGVSFCSICNSKECFGVDIWPNGLERPAKTFSVNVGISAKLR
jgi:hypothetical protein